MDWDLTIKRNSDALVGIVAELFAMLGDATVGRIPLALYHAVLRVLHPAESAMRRLIVIAAHGLVVKLVPSRPMLVRPLGEGDGSRRPSFKLFDTRKRFAQLSLHRGKLMRNLPRIHVFGYDPRVVALFPARPPVAVATPAPPPDGLVNAERLSRRLEALKSALDDLPRQARRLARWRLRREAMPSPKFTSPLRPGPPPGHRKKPVLEVDDVLIECHGVAWDALKPDTS